MSTLKKRDGLYRQKKLHSPWLREVRRQLSPALRKIWKSASRIKAAPHFPRRNLRIGRRLRDPRAKHRRLEGIALALMMLSAVVQVGRPLREGHRRRPLSRTVRCCRVRPWGRGGVGDPATPAAESPALVRRAVLNAEILIVHHVTLCDHVMSLTSSKGKAYLNGGLKTDPMKFSASFLNPFEVSVPSRKGSLGQ